MSEVQEPTPPEADPTAVDPPDHDDGPGKSEDAPGHNKPPGEPADPDPPGHEPDAEPKDDEE